MWLLILAALLLGCAYSFRWFGYLRLEWEIREHGIESPPRAGRGSVDPGEDAALEFRSLEELVESGEVDLHPDEEDLDPVADAALLAAVAAFGSTHEQEEITLSMALDQATDEILTEREPCPEARTLVESWLPRLERAFTVVDRVCEHSQWRFEHSEDPLEWPDAAWVSRVQILNEVVLWVSVAAVHEARNGDLSLALRRLRQSFHLARAERDEPSSISFLAVAYQLTLALESLQQLLRDLPSGEDVSWVVPEVEGVDSLALLQRSAAFDRYQSLELYRRGRVKELFLRSFLSGAFSSLSHLGGSEERIERPAFGLLQACLYPVIAGHDATRFLELSSELLERLDGSLAETSRELDGLAGRWGPAPWYAPTATYMASLLTLGLEACVDLESRLRLVKIALADHEHGRAAALGLLEGWLDPADDQPIRQREEDDGTLTLWCLGSDRIDMDGTPSEGDVVGFLPSR